MSVLQALLESRDSAQNAYEAFINPLIESGEALTDEQTEKRAELRSAVETLDVRIDEVAAEEKRAAKLAETRQGIGATDAPKATAEVSEPTTYGPGSENSYYLDLAYVTHGPLHPNYRSATERLTRGSHEAAWEMVHNKSEEKRDALRSLVAEEKRRGSEAEVRAAVKRAEALGTTGRGELRTGMDTTAGSGGSFATPVYFVGDYAPYREAGRAFINECNAQDLPAYGMTVYLPHVTGGAAVAAQSSQNTGVQETDPTAGYLSSNLTTEAGQVTVSQQLLDRAGPGFSFDKLVFDQLNRDYNPKVDVVALNAALAGAGTIAYTDSTGFHLSVASGVGGFTSKVSGAKAAIRKTAGTFLNPTHMFVDPNRWEYISGTSDVNGNPSVVPDYAGAFKAWAAGSASGDEGIEGNTGFKMKGLRVFQDANIPVPTAGADQALVAVPSEVYVFEGTPVTRALPQTLGNQLSVILQQYSYIAVIVRYASGVQTITGTGMAAITW